MLIKSIFGGIGIAIGSYLFLQIANPIIGAFCFAIGLLVILNLKLKLYTGAIGYVSNLSDLKDALIILVGNAIGCCLMFAYPTERAIEIVSNKLAHPLYLTFINAIICGILIYCAVECFKNGKDYMVIAAVASFIIFGAEHSIADMCYIFSARIFNWNVLLFIIIVIIGNAIGSLIFNWVVKKK